VTMIIVTHRISSVERCDRIVYLEDGAVRAAGAFAEVAAAVPSLLGSENGGSAEAVAVPSLWD
jgi:ABC-type transport system involved in cytochrome bd biosynthesis fused ATPase/permease subunit